MKMLAIDTSTEACSAALSVDGQVTQQYRIAPREHSHIILPMIDQLLKDAGIKVTDIDALAFGRGPGSFMGVRIAAGVTQGIGFAHDIPVVPVSTLAAIAQTAYTETGARRVLSAIDARMNEVYWGAYQIDENGFMRLLGEEQVLPPGQVPQPDGTGWTGAGTGWAAYGDALLDALERGTVANQIPDCYPSAQAIVELAATEYAAGNHVPAARAVPVYLRDNVAKKSAA